MRGNIEEFNWEEWFYNFEFEFVPDAETIQEQID